MKIQLLEDTIVEAAERFSVQVEQVISSSDLVFGLEPEFAVVTILDNDGMLFVIIIFVILLLYIVVTIYNILCGHISHI